MKDYNIAVLVRAHRRGTFGRISATYLFSNSPHFTPKTTLLYETLKHSERCLWSLGRGALGGESASAGVFERITTEENERISGFVPGLLTGITQSFKQATWGQESSQGLPQVEGVDRRCSGRCRSGIR